MSVEQKRGPWSKEDKRYIAENAKKLTVEVIAANLHRNIDAVRKYIRDNHESEFTETAAVAKENLRNSPIWLDLEKQFSEEELEMFLFHWGRIISQFKDDVYPTEELQVIDTIKLEVLMNRSLTTQRQISSDITRLEGELLTEREHEPKNVGLIMSLERQIGVLMNARDSSNKAYQEMLAKKGQILDKMKATRDARVKSLEMSRTSFAGWMRQLLTDKETRKKIGEQAEKMKLAHEAEKKRLTEYHTFINGEIDQILTNAETVL
jgi:hypothetical protein